MPSFLLAEKKTTSLDASKSSQNQSDGPRRILGVDPGIGTTGYGLLEESGRGVLTLIHSGEIRTLPRDPFSKRLKIIYDGLTDVMATHPPTAVAVEDTYLAKNFKAALKLGQAKGMALLAAEVHHLPVFEYTPTAIKMAAVGYGVATKLQVQVMVTRLLHLATPPASDHEADAIAVAICHAHSSRFQNKLSACGGIGKAS